MLFMDMDFIILQQCVTGNLRRTAASSSIVYQQTTMPPPDPASEVLDIGLIGHVSDESDYDL